MGKIVLLDDLTINQIAAGEVIERPASVVKELVENSIDANAKNITVEIKNGGISYIKVTDDGSGIMPDDMEIAFERHATSKIRKAEDLDNVKSMGFRGEALASIAAIAKVELVSKTPDSDMGYVVYAEGGNVTDKHESGSKNGTSITVKELFYNTPVRYKFLKKDFTESGYIEDTITRIALANPGVAIKLINSGKIVIQTNGSGKLEDVVYAIYGKEVYDNILPVDYTYEDYHVTGVIGKPIISRSNRTNQLFFVNKRYIKDKTLTSAAEQGFKGLVTIGKHGFLILNIDMDPSKVDVNVHPTKLEVRFQEDSKVFKAVYHAIKETLLKSDLNLFSDNVFAFTPSGDVKNLPKGSTPIDFAYSIHSAVGNKMVGAKVNGKLVPIDYVIKNGDQIEVITSQNSKGPSRDWLKIVKSTQAKNKINQWFRSELKEENIQHGKDLIAAYAKAKGINFAEINKPEYQEKIRRKYGFHDWNSCLATVGHGGLKESQIVNRMYDEYKKDHVVPVTDADVLGSIAEKQQAAAGIQPERKSKSGIVVHGLYDVAVHFSKCCNPVPGDEIVGFVTRGRGISIHRTDCVNIINLSKIEKDRLIEAEWQDTALMDNGAEYQADLKIFCHDRPGLLVDITKIFTEKEINISGIQSKTSKQGIATIEVFFNIRGRDQIKVLVEKLRQIESVIDVERTTG